jgi:hypothetical protein
MYSTIQPLYNLPSYYKQYKKLYEEQKKQNRQLKKENENLKRQVLLTHERFQFNERQLAIIEYIRKHRGKTKIDLISKLQNSANKSNVPQYGTYVTLHKEIGALQELNIIRIEKVHKQKHKLYLNDNSLLLRIYIELNKFRNSFGHLLDEVSTNKKWKEYRSSTGWMERMNADRLLHYLVLIYYHVLSVYLTYILLKWSVELRNDETLLNKIYSLVFFSYIEINNDFAQKFELRNRLPNSSKDKTNYSHSPILYEITSKTFFLDPYTIMAVIRDFHGFGLYTDIVPLIDISWKIGLNLYRFIEGSFLNQFEGQINDIVTEDWKRLVSFYLEKKFNIDPLSPEFPSRFKQPSWFHRDKNLIKNILS